MRRAGIEAEAHRAALLLHVALVGHEVDHGVGGEHVELGGVGVLRPEHVPRKLDDAALEPEAQAQVRDLVLAGVVRGQDLALDAAMPEPARDEDPGRALEPLVEVVVGELLRVDPADLRVDLVGAQAACLSASVTERYASGSSMYLPTSAISRIGLGRLIRSTMARQVDRSGSGAVRPSSRTIRSPMPAASNRSGTS